MFSRLCLCLLLAVGRLAAGVVPDSRPEVSEAPAPPLSAPFPFVPRPPSSMPDDILRYVNEYRHSKHLKPLQADSYISSIALQHSRNMLTGKTPFGHQGFKDRIELIKKRLGPLHIAAENVASGPMSAREVVDGWLHSPGHRRNIEGDFRLTGIGLAHARNGMIYFTQIFVR